VTPAEQLTTRRDDARTLRPTEVDADSLITLSYLAGGRNEGGNHQQESNLESSLCTRRIEIADPKCLVALTNRTRIFRLLVFPASCRNCKLRVHGIRRNLRPFVQNVYMDLPGVDCASTIYPYRLSDIHGCVTFNVFLIVAAVISDFSRFEIDIISHDTGLP
jgi:hypothetical protein